MRSIHKCWNQEKHLSLLILEWRSKHHFIARWSQCVKKIYGVSGKWVIALKQHGDTRPPAAWRRNCSSWGQGHCCVGERPNSGRYVLATHGEILLLWDIARFVLYSCMLTAFLNYSLTKSTFMYMSVIKQYFYYGNNFTWKSIHSLKSFKKKKYI